MKQLQQMLDEIMRCMDVYLPAPLTHQEIWG
nr:MAG TPA: hypothetical protein [Caudoviricetes sp.]